ncbi:hypothetical protein SAMN04487910_1508 [Aquimarina amphilecti]|uniref:Uncharacterized protein n=1 Tax=Aquimarina amphilecti TaxID=1038014 RepID=A0A1H7L2M0_AQUAM|nr:hypothetical protein [Aquimarina amphilecti]SEK93323.1 hypothetical protein SAMN04487910_1508 [Aquimarina amphilecti]
MKHTLQIFKSDPYILISILCISFLLFSCDDKVIIEGNNDTAEVTINNDYKKIPAPISFSADIPVDVNPVLQQKLKDKKEIFKLNEKFNEYSWQTFIAIMWPRDDKGKPAAEFTDKGTPTWLDWKEAFQVYRSDGKTPAPWGSPRTASGLGLSKSIIDDTNARIVLSSSTPTNPKNFDIADEVDQAFAGKLFDQNGNVVVYEVLMNKEEFDYIVTNKLYNINGQTKFSESGIANFPKGNYQENKLGAIEIKFAWKILEDSDIKDRYYQEEGYIIGSDGTSLVKKDLGMIGFHISQKTPTGKQWVWSTFEHIDNLDQNVIEKDGKTTVVPPSLRDPNCEICPVNIDVTNGGTTYTHNKWAHGDFWTISSSNTDMYYAESDVMKTQAKRMVAIPVRVQRVNERMQTYFKQQKSVWQYYQLIDTQYPTDQNALPGNHTEAKYKVPESVVNKPGGNPNLALLTNITMETFFQTGNQSASNLMEANPVSDITIFGTESCMGCHSSAGIYEYKNGKLSSGDQLTGDFSWLLGKAQWEEGVPKKPSN